MEKIVIEIKIVKLSFNAMSLLQITIGAIKINIKVKLCILLKSRLTNIAKYRIKVGKEKIVK